MVGRLDLGEFFKTLIGSGNFSFQDFIGKKIELIFDDKDKGSTKIGRLVNIFLEYKLIVIINDEGYMELYPLDRLIRIKLLEKIVFNGGENGTKN